MRKRFSDLSPKTSEFKKSAKYADKRSFLRQSLQVLVCLIALGSLTSGGCSQKGSTLPRPYRAKYNTIAHKILDIELEHLGTNDAKENYILVDVIIDAAKERVDAMDSTEGEESETPREKALRTLGIMSELLDNYGFEYQKDSLLCHGLIPKKINCHGYSALYLAMGEGLGLPLKMVRAPGHAFIRWQLGRREYVNWETTAGVEKDDDYYINRYNIAPESRGRTYLRSLDLYDNREEILANAYVNNGVQWLKKCRLEKAIERFKEAIDKDPSYDAPYYDIGLTYWHLDKPNLAIKWCEKALKLNPNHLRSHVVLEAAYSSTNRELSSHKHFVKVLKTQPNYYARGAVEKRRKNRNICVEDS